MGKKTILILNAGKDTLKSLEYALSREGYNVVHPTPAEKGEDLFRKYHPNLIILDTEFKGKNGFGVLKALKEDLYTRHVPIVMLTVGNSIEEEIGCLENGADDSISRPFSSRVLAARVKAVLRSRQTDKLAERNYIQLKDIKIDPKRRVAVLNGRTIDLTYSEFEILFCLARNAGWVLSRDDIINKVHGKDYSVADRSVDVQIYGLRKKLGNWGRCIETVRGIGYRLNA